jgi:division protein CdvB (Snf7/Vps24/ESCRT-III family)
MSFFADTALQGKLLKDIQDLYTKRTQLEASIRQLDALSLFRIEKAAMREIDAYRARLSRPQLDLF